MGRLLVRPQAEEDVDAIAATIARDKLDAALRFYDRAQASFEFLSDWPQAGTRRRTRDVALRGLRSYPIRGYRNYLVFYLPLGADGVDIVRVIHGARDLPTALA